MPHALKHTMEVRVVPCQGVCALCGCTEKVWCESVIIQYEGIQYFTITVPYTYKRQSSSITLNNTLHSLAQHDIHPHTTTILLTQHIKAILITYTAHKHARGEHNKTPSCKKHTFHSPALKQTIWSSIFYTTLCVVVNTKMCLLLCGVSV